jgi:uncharacterized membrane protein SpoIIM required for sporulation
MTVDRFVEDRSASWTELDALLRAAGSRPERLGPARLRRLGTLYRAAAADLAFTRRRWPNEPAVLRLEDLVTRGRLAVYGRTARRRTLRAFLARGYWQRVRERPRILALAIALLVAPVGLTAVWGHEDPNAAVSLVPGELRGDGSGGNELDLAPDQQAQMSSEIMTNNIRVTFFARAGGITGGVVTALVLVFNGALLGAVGGIFAQAGSGSRFLELVLPHGVLELSCIVVAGAAGLRMGAALLVPGDRTRRAALVDAAHAATELTLGTAPWLVVAGMVEGFVTPRQIGLPAATIVGVGLGVVYWTLVALRGGPAPSA